MKEVAGSPLPPGRFLWEAEREDAVAREGREGPPQLAAPVEWIRTRVLSTLRSSFAAEEEGEPN